MNYLQLNTPLSYAFGGNGMELFMPNAIVIPPPSPDTIPGHSLSVIVCFKDSITLHAPENAHCPLWDNGSIEMNRKIKEAGSYTLGYFNDACTYTTDTFLISFVPKPDFPTYIHGCSGGINLLVKNKEGNYATYSYNLRNEDSSFYESAESNTGYNFTNLEAGNYALQISTEQGCDTTFSIYLEGYPKPEITASPVDTIIRYGDSIQIRAIGAKQYAWWPPGPLDTATKANPIARPLSPVLFTVLGINDYGCSDTGFVHVDIDYSMPDIIPNAFSPNGDGLNDVFRVEGVTYQRLMQFRVFNRYGEQVFYTIKAKNGWDGTYQARPCDIGTYYYLIQLAYPDGQEKTIKGNITLLR
jgi:gliding motility-associated-like protein